MSFERGKEPKQAMGIGLRKCAHCGVVLQENEIGKICIKCFAKSLLEIKNKTIINMELNTYLKNNFKFPF